MHPRTIKNLPNGTFDIDELKAKIRDEDQHFPRTRLVGGGVASSIPFDYLTTSVFMYFRYASRTRTITWVDELCLLDLSRR